MMFYSTSKEADANFRLTIRDGWSYDQMCVALLADIRRESKLLVAEARKQTLEAIKQTAALERLDERALRNGFSLAKANRK